MEQDGFTLFGHDERTLRWAKAAQRHVVDAQNDPDVPQEQLRHGRTWFVGLDALPNDASGAVDGVPLSGPWQDIVPELPLHRAQVSIVYPGYPKRDASESLQNHRFRIKRKAAHVDGLLSVGPEKRRYAKELHAYILGIPLDDCPAGPVVVWQGSHHIMRRALKEAIADHAPGDVDVTEVYKAARREVFETCKMVSLDMEMGEAVLIHRFALHGTEIWNPAFEKYGAVSRAIAFFRPEVEHRDDWLGKPFS